MWSRCREEFLHFYKSDHEWWDRVDWQRIVSEAFTTNIPAVNRINTREVNRKIIIAMGADGDENVVWITTFPVLCMIPRCLYLDSNGLIHGSKLISLVFHSHPCRANICWVVLFHFTPYIYIYIFNFIFVIFLWREDLGHYANLYYFCIVAIISIISTLYLVDSWYITISMYFMNHLVILLKVNQCIL